MARLPGVGFANGPSASDCDLLKIGEIRTPLGGLQFTILRTLDPPATNVRLYRRGAPSSRRMEAPPLPRPRSLTLFPSARVSPSDSVWILGPMPKTLLRRRSKRTVGRSERRRRRGRCALLCPRDWCQGSHSAWRHAGSAADAVGGAGVELVVAGKVVADGQVEGRSRLHGEQRRNDKAEGGGVALKNRGAVANGEGGAAVVEARILRDGNEGVDSLRVALG